MVYMGIDYGSKKIGIALSDDRGVIAFPKIVIPRNGAEDFLAEYISQNKVESLVCGESITSDGSHNPVWTEAKAFATQLVDANHLHLDFQTEQWSSVEARRFVDSGKDNDASAAAIILQRFLDKLNTQHT